QIVGGYVDVNNVDHAFLLVNGQFTSFDVPGATSTDAFDIDDSGEIVGVYIDTAGVQHGFVLKDGIFSTLDFPRAATRAGVPGRSSNLWFCQTAQACLQCWRSKRRKCFRERASDAVRCEVGPGPPVRGLHTRTPVGVCRRVWMVDLERAWDVTGGAQL